MQARLEKEGWRSPSRQCGKRLARSATSCEVPSTFVCLLPGSPVAVFPKLSDGPGRGAFNALGSLPDRTEMLVAPVPRRREGDTGPLAFPPSLTEYKSEGLATAGSEWRSVPKVPDFVTFRCGMLG